MYSPNKAVIFHDGLGTAVAEIEFGERIRGLVVRQSTICVALSRRVIAFGFGIGEADPQVVKGKGQEKARDVPKDGFWMRKIGEWETAVNEDGKLGRTLVEYELSKFQG